VGKLSEPVFGCIYGPSGVGKTTDTLYSFPRALFVAPPGALKPAATVVGYAPRTTKREAMTVMEVTDLLSRIDRKEFDAVCVDDFSLLVERTVMHFNKKLKGWDLWRTIRNKVIEFRDAARSVGVHVMLNAHEKAPEVKDGKLIRGGPALPGQLPNDLPPATDLCLRAWALPKTEEPTAQLNGVVIKNRIGWPVVYRCDVQEADWSTKDRHGVTPEFSPMNVGEILRLAGYDIRRAPGLEWQEDVVERVSEYLVREGVPLTKDAAGPILAAAVERIRQKGLTDNPMHIRWTLRDAVDRAALKRARSSMLTAYGVG